MKYQTNVFGLLTFYVLVVSDARNINNNKERNNDGDAVSAQTPYVKNQCAYGEWKSLGDVPAVNIPQPSWLQTPSIVEINTGYYQALGRVIHAVNLKDQLNLNLDDERADIQLVDQLEILADTFYIKDEVAFYGIKTVKIFAREIIAAPGSKMIISTPNWNQEFPDLVPQANGDGSDGEDGKDGKDGPQVEIICDVITGAFEVSSKGGDGHKGQDGGPGADAPDSSVIQPDYHTDICPNSVYNFFTDNWASWKRSCTSKSKDGRVGETGKDGGNGGNAGKSGNGGQAGRISLRYRKQNGQTILKTCGGTGGQSAKNGEGGKGGNGGQGGRGVECFIDVKNNGFWDVDFCEGKQTAKAADGSAGKHGAPGSTPNVKGEDGAVSEALIEKGTLDEASKKSIPAELLVVVRRQAVDLLLGDRNNQKGIDALRFIKDVTTGRNDVEQIRKDAERKLAFLDVEGYDIFGKNSLFVPLIKWEAFYEDVQTIKSAAEVYEQTFNDIMTSVQNNENFQQVLKKKMKVVVLRSPLPQNVKLGNFPVFHADRVIIDELTCGQGQPSRIWKMASKFSDISSEQVKAQKNRLIAARDLDESEKRMYIKGIKSQEQRMEEILVRIMNLLPEGYEKTKEKLDKEQLMAVVQGVTGFAAPIAGKDPLIIIDSAVSVMDYEINKPCLESLDTIRGNLKKWLTFGEEYEPLEDSSDFDFDKVEVSAIPEVMKANLEISKEKLASDLVCLLEEAARPRDVAALKAEIESYFIVGGARIDMIGKVMELDNNIGTYNFDIPMLEETETGIIEAGKSQGTLSTDLRQTFTDNLLSTYKQLERSFMIKLYELQKALGFKTLWNLDDLIGSFRRIASESALGVGRLNGAVELTKELQKLSEVIDKVQMFQDLQQGFTRFSIEENEICPTCYNARLIKMYIELYGSPDSEKQDKNIPDKIHLRVRHLSGSHFLAGDNKMKTYRQPVTDFRDFKFDRFTISNEGKCRKAKQEGRSSSFCVEKNDDRWKPMCSHSLNGAVDSGLMMGEEECTSPPGYYELLIPVDKNLECSASQMRDTNCKDLDLTKFTKMNVWVYYLYWSNKYPVGPDDPICRVATMKRNQTEIDEEKFPVVSDENKL